MPPNAAGRREKQSATGADGLILGAQAGNKLGCEGGRRKERFMLEHVEG